jgi:hypothetical protein
MASPAHPEIHLYWDLSKSMIKFYRSPTNERPASAMWLLWDRMERLWLPSVSHVQYYRRFGVGNGVKEIESLVDAKGRTIPPVLDQMFTHLALASLSAATKMRENANLRAVFFISDLILEVPPASVTEDQDNPVAPLLIGGNEMHAATFTPSLFGLAFKEGLAYAKSLHDLGSGVFIIRNPVPQRTTNSVLFVLWFARGQELGKRLEAKLLEELETFDPDSRRLLVSQDGILMARLGNCGFQNSREARATFPLIGLDTPPLCDFFCQGKGLHRIHCEILEPSLDGFPNALRMNFKEARIGDHELNVVNCEPGAIPCVEIFASCALDEEGQVSGPRITLFHQWGAPSSGGESLSFSDWIPSSSYRREEVAELLKNLQYQLMLSVPLRTTQYEISYHR